MSAAESVRGGSRISPEERQRRAMAARKRCGEARQGMAKKRGHPTTSDHDYTPDECEFMFAVQKWKEQHPGEQPTCVDILGIAQILGYARTSPPSLSVSLPVDARAAG